MRAATFPRPHVFMLYYLSTATKLDLVFMGVRSYEKQLEASSCLSVRTDELGSRWTDFRTICIR